MVYKYIIAMAVVTYLIRMLPLTVYRKKIENKTVKSFLYYVPYTCLTAMTFPGILYSTESIVSAAAGLIVAVIFGLKEKGLVLTASAACVTVFVVERVMELL